MWQIIKTSTEEKHVGGCWMNDPIMAVRTFIAAAKSKLFSEVLFRAEKSSVVTAFSKDLTYAYIKKLIAGDIWEVEFSSASPKDAAYLASYQAELAKKECEYVYALNLKTGYIDNTYEITSCTKKPVLVGNDGQ